MQRQEARLRRGSSPRRSLFKITDAAAKRQANPAMKLERAKNDTTESMQRNEKLLATWCR